MPETAFIEPDVCEKQRFIKPGKQISKPKKKSFEEAVAECDGRPVSEFFDELRRQVKEY